MADPFLKVCLLFVYRYGPTPEGLPRRSCALILSVASTDTIKENVPAVAVLTDMPRHRRALSRSFICPCSACRRGASREHCGRSYTGIDKLLPRTRKANRKRVVFGDVNATRANVWRRRVRVSVEAIKVLDPLEIIYGATLRFGVRSLPSFTGWQVRRGVQVLYPDPP